MHVFTNSLFLEFIHMDALIAKLDRFFMRIIQIERIIGIILLICMLIVCFGAVIMRYFINRPWSWSDEIQMIFIVFFGYICISVDVYYDQHVSLTLLYNKLSSKYRLYLDLFRHTLIGAFSVLMCYYGFQMYQIKARKLLAATHLSQGLVFSAQYILSAIMVLFCLLNLAKTFLRGRVQEGGYKE